MGFLVNRIAGNGSAQAAVTNDATVESVVNSLVAHNTTAGTLSFSVLVDGSTIFTENVSANGTYRIPDKINLGATKTLSINAATGVNVTVSYLQQAIDVAGALSAAQLLAQAASHDADRAEAALGTTTSPVVTGGITIDGSLKETSVAMPANNIDLSLANHFRKTISGTVTLTVSNVAPTGTLCFMVLELLNAKSGTLNWFDGIEWAGGTAPDDLTVSGKDIITFYTWDAGTTWNVMNIQRDVK